MSLEHNLPHCQIPNDESAKSLNKLTDYVDCLYKLRDYYFETHPIEDAVRKNDNIQKELKNILVKFEEINFSAKKDRAKYFYLKGKALNISHQYTYDAEENLSRAIKLDPKLVNAWNELGESYWKNDNLTEAKNCFETALKENRNKISLRCLSMISRQELGNTDDKLKKIEEGVLFAKEAVQLDPQDGLSWAVLGNAHLSSYFLISQNPKILRQCISAYCQAEKDVIAKSTPDLHYNKAITLKYEEEFKLALESFNQSTLYDPSWDAPKIKQQQLIKYLNNVNELVNTTGKMKGKKRLQHLLQSINSKHLGPYSGGSYTSANGQTVKLNEIPISQLEAGVNNEKVILGKVVCSVYSDDSVPFTYCLVDKKGSCVSVTVYNLAEGKGVIIGDTVAIPEPFVTNVNFSFNNMEYNFRSIRVETPLIMVVNGKKLNRDQQANVQMSILKKVG